MTKQFLTIIGNGMATCRLLDEIFRRGGQQMYDITVFGEEAHGAYNRILLNRVLEGFEIDEITLKPLDWYAGSGVRFFPGLMVTKIAQAEHRLWTSDGKEHYYDTAVFATGSLPRVPAVDGLQRPDGKLKTGVFAYRTVADVEKMRKHARTGMPAIVIGGGLLGLEAAKGLSDLGLQVTVIHNDQTLMNRQVDRIGGEFLRSSIEKLGITIRTSMTTQTILGTDRVESVEFANGERLEAEMVVFASGIKPRTDLAEESGVPTNRGILVNDQMETHCPNIYALGECAEHEGVVYGTVQPIYEQCGVLADVLTGTNPDASYRGSKVYTKLKVAGIEVASMGLIEADHPDDEVIQVIEERRRVYRKLIVREGRLAGAVLVGDSSASASLVRLFDSGVTLPALRIDVFASGLDGFGGGSGSDPEVCNCHHVKTSTLIAAICEGCDNLSALSSKTQAGTGCGSCRGQLADLILKHNQVGSGREKG